MNSFQRSSHYETKISMYDYLSYLNVHCTKTHIYNYYYSTFNYKMTILMDPSSVFFDTNIKNYSIQILYNKIQF